MRQWLRLRDARCTFPNCNNHSLDNDADHILAWADGGGTGITNLGQTCPKHHRLKHTTAWKPVGATRESPPGWISPAGRHYPSEHEDWEPPTWPEPPPGQERQWLLDWSDRPGLPEPPDGSEPPDWPEPPDGSESPDREDEPDGSEDSGGRWGPRYLDGLEPPLLVDPLPDWGKFDAA
jgi:hypothetical protein